MSLLVVILPKLSSDLTANYPLRSAGLDAVLVNIVPVSLIELIPVPGLILVHSLGC